MYNGVALNDDDGGTIAFYNQSFVERVWAKRRAKERQEQAEKTRQKRERLLAQRRKAAQERIEARLKQRDEEVIERQRYFESMTERAKAVALARESDRETIPEIIAANCAEHEVTIDELMSPCREARIMECRHDAVAEVYVKWPELSLTQIGRHFGRDHTCVLNSVKKRGVWRNPLSEA